MYSISLCQLSFLASLWQLKVGLEKNKIRVCRLSAVKTAMRSYCGNMHILAVIIDSLLPRTELTEILFSPLG